MPRRRPLSRFERRRWTARAPSLVVAACAAATVTTASSARGATAITAIEADAHGCPVTVTPANSPEPWLAAARLAEARLQETAAESDCAALDIQVSADRAFVVFATRDGRHTVRPLDSPEELSPLVDALLVTVGAAHPPAKAIPMPAAPAQLAALSPKPESAPRVPNAMGAGVVFRASGGARLGMAFSSTGTTTFGSPAFTAGAGVVVGRWELAAFGAWDPQYVVLDRSVPGLTMSRYAIGVSVGHRLVLGAGLVDFGLSASGAITFEEVGGDTGASNVQSPGELEPLLGLYAGFAYPRRSPIRFRTELSTDVAIYRPSLNAQSQPPPPRWSTTASVGAEWEVP